MDRRRVASMPKSYDKVKEDFAQKHCFILSVVVTILVITLSAYFNVPDPAVVCFIAVVLSTFAGGFFCGSISGSLTILYCGYFFSEPGYLMSYTSQNFYKIFIIFVTTIFMVLMVGILKRQLKNRTEALEKANKQLILFSAVDWLTGIANRRSFDELLDKEWNRGLSEQISVALVLIDVDFFKNYNDSYGHQAGDECLRHVAAAIIGQLSGRGNFAARYGGEEFVVVISDTSIDEAIKVGEDIRSAVEELRIPSGIGNMCPYVTISVGIHSVVPSEDMSSDELVRAADFALYQAKTSGRNMVKVYNKVVENA